MGLIAEGLRSVLLPCSLAVLVPGLLVVLASGRAAVGAVAGYSAGLLVMAWIRFGGHFGLEYRTPALVVAAVILLAGVGLVRAKAGGDPSRGTVPAGAAAVGGVAAWLWRPCVGLRLGSVLSGIRTDLWGNLVPLALFVVGLMVPLVVLAALPVAWPKLGAVRDSVVTGRAGVAGTVVLAGALAIGVYDDVVVFLFRVSTF